MLYKIGNYNATSIRWCYTAVDFRSYFLSYSFHGKLFKFELDQIHPEMSGAWWTLMLTELWGSCSQRYGGVSGLCVSNVTTAPPSLRNLHVCGVFPHALSSLIPHILNIWELNAFCIHTVREYSQTHFLCIIDSVSAWLTPPPPHHTASRAPWSQKLRSLVLLGMWWKLPGALTDTAVAHQPWTTRRWRGEGRVSTPSLRCPI